MKIIHRLISWILTLSLIFSISAQAWADTLTLPSSVKEIEEEAFLSADSLDEVVVPEGALSIGSRAFASSGVKKISLPESLSYIADDAFWDTNPTVSAIKGSYAYRWAAAHDLIMTLAFKDLSAYDYTTERAVFSENREIGLYHESWIRNYELANYEALEKKYGGEPEWSVEFVGNDYGASLWAVIGEWAGEGARAVDVGIDNEPELPCTLRYQVTCAWGGETITADGTLVYREAALPTGLDAPDEFHGLKVGEPYAFRQNVTPIGYTFGDFVYRDLWTYMDCDNWDEWENGECISYIRPHEAGVFPATLVKRYNNIQMRKNVVLYVADENGNVPAAVPKLEEDYWFDMAVSVDDDSKYSFSIDNRTLGISFQNMQLLRSLYGDDCYWTFETVEGRQTELTWTDQTEYFEFSVNKFNTMTEGDEALIEATLHWGEDSATTRFHFTFFRFEMPDQIEFDQNISMTVNETYRATVRVAPENWKEKYFLYYDVIGTDAVEKWNDEDYSAYYLQAHQPGYFVARPHIHAADNVFIWGDTFSMLVYDADGKLPDPLPVLYLDGEVFEYGYMIGDSDAQDGEGWVITPMAFSRMIENLPALCAAYGDDPVIEWGYNYTGGMEVELELVPWQSDRFVGDACSVRINEMPTSTGYMEFNMTCDWNGHRGVQPCKLWFFNKPERIPHTNTIPEDITVKVGETAYFYGDYPEGEYDIPSYYCWIEADNEFVNVIQNQAEPRIVGITGLQEGTITAYARVGVVENSYVQKPITIHIVQAEDWIIEQLEEVLEQMDESDAFALLNEDWIELPTIDALGKEYADYVELFNEEQTQYLGYARQYNKAITQARESFNALCKISETYTLTDTGNGLSMGNDGLQLSISSDVLDLLGQEYEVESVDITEDGCVIASLRNNSGQEFFISIQGEKITIGSNPILEVPALRSSGIAVLQTGAVARSAAPQVPESWDNLANLISLTDDIVSLSQQFISNTANSLTQPLFNWNADEIAKQSDHLNWLDNWEKQIKDPETLKLLQDAKVKAHRKIDLRRQSQSIMEGGGKFFKAIADWLPLVGSVADIESIYQARVKMLELDNLKKHGHPTEYEHDEETRNLINRMNTSIDYAQQDYWATITVNTVSALLGVAPLRMIKGAGKTCQKIATFMNDLKLTDYTIAGLDIANMITGSFNADRLYSYAFELDECLHFELGGMVQDAKTGKPIEGAEVTCLMNNYTPMTTRTDVEGVFYFEPLTPTVEIVVEKENYKATDPIPLPSTGILQKDTRCFEIIKLEEKPGILSGEVRAESDLKPLEGAIITAGDTSAATDAKGKYYMELPEGIYTISCVCAGYLQSSLEHVEMKKGETTVVRPFLLEKGYEIWDREDLEAVADNLSETFVVCADIDLSDSPWTPLPWFSGTLDGCGHIISGMHIQESSGGNAGLFAGLSGATIKNLTISNATISVPADSAFTNTGVLCGNMVQNAAVSDSAFSGSITVSDGDVSGSVFAGGISGLANAGSFSNCESSVNVEAQNQNSIHIGGLFGQMHSGSISRCSYNGSLMASQSGSNTGAQITASGIGYSGSIQGLYCTVAGSVRASAVDGEALAYGLATTYHGDNHASVSASSQNRAFAVGAQDCNSVNNYGAVSAKSTYKSADAAGINSCMSSNNYGSITASSVYGDVTAIGVVSYVATCKNYGSASAYSAYGDYYAGNYPYGVE